MYTKTLRYVHTCTERTRTEAGGKLASTQISTCVHTYAVEERQQNPLRNKWVQHPIFRVRFETARSNPSLSIKLRSHMRGAETGGFWHSRSATAVMFTNTRSGRGRICHFLRTMMVWSARFRSGRGKLGVGPISCGADFAPAPPPLRDRACVNACNYLYWSQFSARACVNVP